MVVALHLRDGRDGRDGWDGRPASWDGRPAAEAEDLLEMAGQAEREWRLLRGRGSLIRHASLRSSSVDVGGMATLTAGGEEAADARDDARLGGEALRDGNALKTSGMA